MRAAAPASNLTPLLTRLLTLLFTFLLTCSLTARPVHATHAAHLQDAAPVEVPKALPLALVDASVAEAEALNRLAIGQNWTARALAVMRLERYDCEASAGRLRAFLLDPSWRVRAYAIACLARRGVLLPPETLAAESDPRVVRAI
ncbi:MAG: hypothetical protein ACKO3W_04255, partial [bacterium]